jgi:hypothetical protein
MDAMDLGAVLVKRLRTRMTRMSGEMPKLLEARAAEKRPTGLHPWSGTLHSGKRGLEHLLDRNSERR